MTGGQMSELFCVLLIPIFFRRLGVKYMLAAGMGAWVLRYLLFAYGLGMFVGSWLSGTIVNRYAVTASDESITHDWRAIWISLRLLQQSCSSSS